ncbi:CPBP family intramembrane glutamic endopeptidase [Paenibacillus aestuarii]|uniref:CPBP family intramembrane metalloprotease n=1 Tax=Paenibacillus aestuarii TaxID=516965 RepID=A0ABW0K2Y1_9BACL|nr:CPBP family intramembrane metalloprotease [Paenibacillus aestuarii]
MIELKLNRFLLLLAVIGIALYATITALYGLHEEDAAPTDNPSITKQQAAERAAQFVLERYNIHDPQTFVVYQSEKERSGYLQKEQLTDVYEQKYGDRFPIDFYQVRVVDQATDRRFDIEVNYRTSQIIGWNQISDISASMNKQKADIMAKEELRKQGWNPDDFVQVNKPNTSRDQRMTLVYEKQGGADAIGEARLQLQMNFDNQSIIGYNSLFSLPASYQAWLDQQDHSASVMTWVSMGFTLLMSLAAVLYIIKHRKRVDFRRGLLLTVIFVVIYIINNINMYPAYKSMAGASNEGLAMLLAALFMNAVTMLLGVALYLALAAGNAWWEQSGWRPWPSWRERRFGEEVWRGMGRGYLLALFILGVQQVLFYWGEKQFDVWSVNDPSDSVLNMLEPRLFPLMAWVAAISEEATFRLLGIVLFKRIFRNNFIAVLIPSIIWAASHTQYPIYPVYTRLVEVTVIGLILGYVFLKYGFITAMFAHACMDSILMGMSLFSIGYVSDAIAGAFYILLPALIALLISWMHKRRGPLTPGEPPPRLEAL